MMSQTNENALLKAGCILLMAAGAVCQGISVWNSLSVGRQTQNMEPEIYDTLNQAMQQQTGGQAGADVAIQALQGLSVVMAVLCVVVLAVLAAADVLERSGFAARSEPGRIVFDPAGCSHRWTEPHGAPHWCLSLTRSPDESAAFVESFMAEVW